MYKWNCPNCELVNEVNLCDACSPKAAEKPKHNNNMTNRTPPERTLDMKHGEGRRNPGVQAEQNQRIRNENKDISPKRGYSCRKRSIEDHRAYVRGKYAPGVQEGRRTEKNDIIKSCRNRRIDEPRALVRGKSPGVQEGRRTEKKRNERRPNRSEFRQPTVDTKNGSEEWGCPRCTFLNKNGVSCCGVCGFRNTT
eukprot:UN02615